jgi:outer membrane protein
VPKFAIINAYKVSTSILRQAKARQPIFFNAFNNLSAYFREHSNSIMKNVQLVFNVLLSIAVVTLFALFLKGKKQGTSEISVAEQAAAATDLRIAFFHSDSITANYEMFKQEKEGLDQKMKEAEDKFAARQRNFEKEAADFQERAQYLTMTEKEKRQEQLYRQQQELMQMEQTLSGELARAESEVNVKIAAEIETFLKEYAETHKFTYILSYKQGANVWYADPRLDITKDILQELNERYQKKKPE